MNLDNSKNLLIIKSKIKKISNEYKKFKKNKFTKPSSFWDFSSSLIDYINDLSPKNMKLIRQHVALSSTGIYPLYDWGVNAFSGKSKKQLKQIPFVKKYLELIRNVPKKYHYSEPLSDPVSNIISAKIDGKLIARDGLSSQLALTNLYNMGVFDQINLRSKRCKILEIGSGFGLLAYNIKKAIKKDSTYVICDLPSTLILAATFLTNNYPNKKIYLYDPSNYSASKLPNILKKYSFVILPNYKFNDLDRILDFDLIINMASFLEMNSLQIDTYLKSIKKKKNVLFIHLIIVVLQRWEIRKNQSVKKI